MNSIMCMVSRCCKLLIGFPFFFFFLDDLWSATPIGELSTHTHLNWVRSARRVPKPALPRVALSWWECTPVTAEEE